MSLNENQERRLGAALRTIEERLAGDSQAITSPIRRHLQDEQRRRLRDLRDAMLRELSALTECFALPTGQRDELRTINAALAVIWVTLEELRGDGLRGSGEIDPADTAARPPISTARCCSSSRCKGHCRDRNGQEDRGADAHRRGARQCAYSPAGSQPQSATPSPPIAHTRSSTAITMAAQLPVLNSQAAKRPNRPDTTAMATRTLWPVCLCFIDLPYCTRCPRYLDPCAFLALTQTCQDSGHGTQGTKRPLTNLAAGQEPSAASLQFQRHLAVRWGGPPSPSGETVADAVRSDKRSRYPAP
jgi:hypothetical protein